MRRELKNVKEENEALRFQCVLRDDEFRTEEKERRRAQAELQRVKAQLLQQPQRQPEERQVFYAPLSLDYSYYYILVYSHYC